MQRPVTDRLAYPIDEVGALCGGVCVRTVYNWLEAGDLKAIRIGGRRMVLKEDLQAFLDKARAMVAA